VSPANDVDRELTFLHPLQSHPAIQDEHHFIGSLHTSALIETFTKIKLIGWLTFHEILENPFFLIFFICDGQKTETLFPNPFRFAVTFHNSWWEFFCDCVHVYGHGLDRRH
jgi:hypothetical protein